MKTIEFNGEIYNVKRTGYSDNDNTALVLMTNDNEIGTVATVNLGDKLRENQAHIKDYSENTGMYEALLEAGIISKTLGADITGFVMVPLVELNLEDIERMK